MEVEKFLQKKKFILFNLLFILILRVNASKKLSKIHFNFYERTINKAKRLNYIQKKKRRKRKKNNKTNDLKQIQLHCNFEAKYCVDDENEKFSNVLFTKSLKYAY